MLPYLLQLNIIWISFSISFFSQFLQIFISSWRLYHLMAFIAKLWDNNLILVMTFLLLNLIKFRYCSLLKCSFACEEVILFIFTSLKEGLDTTVLSSLLEKYVFVFTLPLIYFIIQYIKYIQDQIIHTVKVQQVSHFCHQSWFLVT